jgi:galactokinase
MSRMATGDLNHLAKNAARRFKERFGRAPKWIVAAPGRVNLIGEHVDYNDGFVLPMAIERYCVIAADVATVGSPVATIFSAATNDTATISLKAPSRQPTPGHWSNYIIGVIAGSSEHGMQPPPFDALVDSTVPFGGGLSSSAAVEVATATLIEAITGGTLEPVTKALLCQKAEHDFAGVPCGIMDMFASAMARADHLMLLDCRSQQIEHIPLVDTDVTVLIMNSNVKHELSGGEYAERRRQCESAARKLGVNALREITPAQLEANRDKLDPVEFRRARHVVTEIERTVTAAAAIRAGDWPTVGQLMYASHDSLRDDFEVSCDELDLLVSLAREIGPKDGVIGSRMTGGGFGGCTVSLVETKQVNAISQALAQGYRAKTGIEPAPIISRPARGAHAIH